jgi:hypothetical protein
MRSLEPVPATVRSRGTSKSAVSRRFVTKTAAQLAAWQTTSLEGLDLVGLLIDGLHIGEHCLIVALGIAADGQKHALGLWDGSTENARVCQDLLANLQSRGLRTDRSLLVILDGSKALRKAVRATFGEAALVQRCQVHKTRNILEYLSDRDRPWAQAIVRRAYQATDVKTGSAWFSVRWFWPPRGMALGVRRPRHRAARPPTIGPVWRSAAVARPRAGTTAYSSRLGLPQDVHDGRAFGEPRLARRGSRSLPDKTRHICARRGRRHIHRGQLGISLARSGGMLRHRRKTR